MINIMVMGGATHVEIRQKIVDYMSRHADYFKMFLGAGDGGKVGMHTLNGWLGMVCMR